MLNVQGIICIWTGEHIGRFSNVHYCTFKGYRDTSPETAAVQKKCLEKEGLRKSTYSEKLLTRKK